MLKNLFRKNVAAPKPVSAEDAERAKQYLQLHSSLDVNEFLASQTHDALFRSPLGPTPECLSIDEVADVVEGQLANLRRAHLAQCADCRRHVELYDVLNKETWTVPDPSGLEPDPFREIEICPNFIRIPENRNLYVVMLNKRNEPVLAELAPESVRITGAIDGKVARVEPLNPEEFGAYEAVKIHFKDDYVLNLPKETGQVCDFVVVTGNVEPFGQMTKRSFVHIIDESKSTAASDFYETV